MKRKALALLLFSVMIFSVIPITANAAVIDSGVFGENDNLKWSLSEDGTLTISGQGRMNGNPNGSLCPGFDCPWQDYKNEIASVVIEQGVTNIGTQSFKECNNLVSVIIPDSVTEMDYEVFGGCDSLTSINIPGSIAHIEDYMFEYCKNLTSVTISDGVSKIGTSAFDGCINLIHIYIPSTVTMIGGWAFCGCEKLTAVSIPNSVTTIGYNAFERCKSLSSITIPSSVTRIADDAFMDCTNLTDVYYEGSVADWNKINIGTSNEILTNAKIHYNSTPSNRNPCETKGHAKTTDVAKAPTCTTTGLAEGSHCSVCGEILVAQKEIPATGHNFVNGICLICGINKNGSTPDDNPSIGTDVPSACSLSELTTVDYLAFSVLAYRDFKNVTEITSVQNFLGDIWDEPWSGDIKYGDLCKHIAGWEPFYVNENKSIGFYAVAFRNSKKEVVIAYRGSRPLSESWNEDTYNDWLVNDLPIILGNKKGTQLYDAIETYNDIAPTYGKSKIVTTGHSLGGALGDIVSAYSGCKGVTFNAVPALDAVYRGAVEIMGPTFAGIDKWNFVDQANENDILAGAWEARNEVVRIKPYVFYQSNATAINIPAHHGLESLVHKDSNENVVMNKQTASFKPNSTISSSVSLAENMSVDFGTSSNDVINKGLELLVAKTSYGGDGFDTITTNIHADTLVGGKHDDELDGGYGNDTYIYFKGDGKDTIIDVAGKDKLYLYGFENSDSFEIVDDEVAGYIFVRCNDNVIVQIKNNNRNQWLNSFKIYIQQGNKTTEHDITEYFSSKNFGAHVLIACPVEIQILDENGTVVYTVKDGEVGNYYTDYGNFYVYEEENGGYGKVLDLVEGYIFKIVGVGTGTMDISYQSVEADGLSEAQVITDVPVSESYVATLEENDNGVFELKQVNKDEESPDDTETSDIPDNSADITVSEVIEDTSDTSDVINTSNDSDSNSSGYGWIIVCVVVAVAIAGIIVYLLNKKKKTA